jgi:hypothetical protein
MVRRAALVLIAAFVSLPAAAQDAPTTLQQLERKYPQMSPVHIKKCDKDDDGLYTRTETLCVASIYRTMYENDN